MDNQERQAALDERAAKLKAALEKEKAAYKKKKYPRENPRVIEAETGSTVRDFGKGPPDKFIEHAEKEHAEYIPGKIEHILTSEEQVHLTNIIKCYLTVNNNTFVKALCKRHNQGTDFVVNKLVEAARLGVPYYIPTHIPEELKYALDFIEERKRLHQRAARICENTQIIYDDQEYPGKCTSASGDSETWSKELPDKDPLPKWMDT